MRRIAQEEFALSYILEIRRKDPGLGGVKLWHMYKRSFTDNKPMGRDRFEALIDRYGLKVRKHLRKPRTTDSRHGLPVYPNLIKEFIPTAPNQLWVSDITYIPVWLNETQYSFCYLSMILDAYTEEIVGWAIARYVELLQKYDIRISMTEDGNPKENPQAERINNTMKNELLKGMRFTSLAEVIEAVAPAVTFYNEERPHMSIDMMTPKEAAACTGELKKHWTSYREIHIKEKQKKTFIGNARENITFLLHNP